MASASLFVLSGCGDRADEEVVQTDPVAPTTGTAAPGAMGTAGTAATSTAATTVQNDLQQRIRQELRDADAITLSDQDLDRLNIQVQGGTVTLSGNVPSQEVSRQIEQRVRQVAGVQTVQNQLQAQRAAE